jgi:hypothetical protein
MASILPPQAAWLQVCGDAKLSFKSRNQVLIAYGTVQMTGWKHLLRRNKTAAAD